MRAEIQWIPDNALWTLGLAVLSWLVAYLFGQSNGRRSQKASEELAAKNRLIKAKDEFGGFIRKQIAALPRREVREFYERTRPEIRGAVYNVWHYLAEDQRTRIDQLFSQYDHIEAQQLDPKNEGTMGESRRALHKIANLPAEFQMPYEVVRYYLDEFYKLSA